MALSDFGLPGAETAIAWPASAVDAQLSVAPPVMHLLREREAARTRAADLARDNQRLEAFLAIASHELRGPVMSSSLGVHLAAQRVDLLCQPAAQYDPTLTSQLSAVQDGLTTAVSNLERLARLVSDLLDLSHIKAGQLGQLRGQPAPADLLTLVRTAVDEQRQLAPTRDIRLHQPPSRGEIHVWADADRLHQVLTNLLTNALKYSPADRPVQVSVRVLKGWARVEVRDHGPGLPPEEHRRIWEAFHWADGIAVTGGTPHASAQSLGLGLYITKTIIEENHGKVGIRSAPGKGSTFWFALSVMPVLAGVRTETEDDEARWLASDAT